MIKFMGVDLNSTFVIEGNVIMKTNSLNNQCQLEVADIYNFDKKYCNQYDGVVSCQTLSWLPDYKDPLRALAKLKSPWIALTSLFFNGNVNCKIELAKYNKPIEQEPKLIFYNIYSLRLIEKFLIDLGFAEFFYTPFNIDVDIPKPDHK